MDKKKHAIGVAGVITAVLLALFVNYKYYGVSTDNTQKDVSFKDIDSQMLSEMMQNKEFTLINVLYLMMEK